MYVAWTTEISLIRPYNSGIVTSLCIVPVTVREECPYPRATRRELYHGTCTAHLEQIEMGAVTRLSGSGRCIRHYSSNTSACVNPKRYTENDCPACRSHARHLYTLAAGDAPGVRYGRIQDRLSQPLCSGVLPVGGYWIAAPPGACASATC